MTSKVEMFLSEYKSKRTREVYEHGLRMFFTDTGLTEDDLVNKLTNLEIKHKLLQWNTENTDKLKANSRLTVMCAVRSFCNSDYVNKPLKFKKGQVGKVEADRNSHVFQKQELKAMFEIGDTFDKAFLSTALSCAYEQSAFRAISRETVKALIQQAEANGQRFIFKLETREKTGEVRVFVLNTLAIEWIKKYLAVVKDDSLFLFRMSKRSVNSRLRILMRKANIKPTGPIRFHRVRSYVEQSLTRTTLSKFAIDMIMGHACDATNNAYLLNTTVQEIEAKYPLDYDQFLNISNGNNLEIKKTVSALELALHEEQEKNKKLAEELEKLKAMQHTSLKSGEVRMEEVMRRLAELEKKKE